MINATEIEQRIIETICTFQDAYKKAKGRKCDAPTLWMNSATAQFLQDLGIALNWQKMAIVLGGIKYLLETDFWVGNNITITNQTHSKRIYRMVFPDTHDEWERFFDQKNLLPLYYCKCRSPLFVSPLNCICQGGAKLTRNQAIETYGFIPHSREVPYCHLCLNQNRDELFPYSFIEFGTDDNSNAKFIYRCRTHHGHDRGWELCDIFTGNIITL